MKKFPESIARVKALVNTSWKRESVKKGSTLEIPEDVLEQNPTIFERVSEEEKAEGLAIYAALNNDLAASGELLAAEALEDPSAASRVSVSDGRTVAGDGPYVETKEHLAGFYLVEVASRERAIEIAGRIPEAAIGGIEVRPVLTYNSLEM